MEPFPRCRVTLVLCSILFSASFLLMTPALKTRPVINFIWVRNCSGERAVSANYLREVNITRLGRDTIVLNVELIVNHGYSKPQVQMELFKCANRDGNKCEFVMNIPISTCVLFEAKNQFWTPIVESIQPPLNCTYVKAGVYRMTNGTIDSSKLMDMAKIMIHGNIFDHFWKCRVGLTSKRRQEYCVEFLVKIDQVKY